MLSVVAEASQGARMCRFVAGPVVAGKDSIWMMVLGLQGGARPSSGKGCARIDGDGYPFTWIIYSG